MASWTNTAADAVNYKGIRHRTAIEYISIEQSINSGRYNKLTTYND